MLVSLQKIPPRDVVSRGTPNCPALLIGKEESFKEQVWELNHGSCLLRLYQLII